MIGGSLFGKTPFGGEVDFSKFKEILNKENININDSYYLSSIISYEVDRCQLHGKSILHYVVKVLKIIIKFIVRKLISLVIEMLQFLLLDPFGWAILALGIIIYTIVIPMIKKRWEQITNFICGLEQFVGWSKEEIDLGKYTGGLFDYQIPVLPEFFPVIGVVNRAFGYGTFDCANAGGSEWNDTKYGLCTNRFGKGAASGGCNAKYATDYTLWDYKTLAGFGDGYKLCTNKMNCIDSPENFIINNSNLDSVSPMYNSGIGKGTAPFKFLACCENPAQKCDPDEMRQARNSINYSSSFPKIVFPGMKNPSSYTSLINEKNYNTGERELIFETDNDIKKYGNFMPITMYQADDLYFSNTTTYLPLSFNKSGNNKFTCLKGDTELLLFLKKWMWISIILFVVYELYQVFYDINYGKQMHVEYRKASENSKTSVVKTYVEGYACNHSIEKNPKTGLSEVVPECKSEKINDAVESFMNLYGKGNVVKHSERGLFGKLVHSHKIDKKGCDIKLDGKVEGKNFAHNDCKNQDNNISSKSAGILSNVVSGSISTSDIMLFILMFVTTFISVSVLYIIKYVRK